MEPMESLQKVNRQQRLAEWSRRVEACRSSGLTVVQWCQENGIAVSTYFSWQRKVFRALKEVQGVLRRGADHGGFSIPRARGSISGNQRRADPSLRGSGYEYAASTAPGGEVMLNDFNCSCPIYIACGYTDLRRGIDGLASIVQSQFQLDPFQKMLFLFCGRRQDRIKGLYWEGDGFLLLYKRLENGAFQWPRNKDEVRQLTPQQYRWLMEGLKTEQPKANKAVSGLSIL